MSLEKLKAEAVKLRQNIDAVYEAGKAAGGNAEAAYNEGMAAERTRYWDSVFQNGERTHFMYGFAGVLWPSEIGDIPYVIRAVDATSTTRSAYGMFYYFNYRARKPPYDMTEVCKKMDLSQTLSAQYMFQAANVEYVTLDLSNVTTAYGLFAGNDGGYRNYITLTVTDKCTNYTNAFHKASELTHLTFTDGSVIAANFSVTDSKILNSESVQSIINALQDRTGLTALTVTFHADVKNKLTEEQQLQVLAKNWVFG